MTWWGFRWVFAPTLSILLIGFYVTGTYTLPYDTYVVITGFTKIFIHWLGR